MKKIHDFWVKLKPMKRQKIIYYGCIYFSVSIVTVLVLNLVFTNQGVGNTHGAEPTEKIITGASRLNPQDAWNERMSNQFDTQEKEINDLRKTIMDLKDHIKKQEDIQKTQEQPFHNNDVSLSSVSVPSSVSSSSPEPINNQFNSLEKQTQTLGDLSFIPGSFQNKPTQHKKRFRSNGISKQQISLHNSKIGKRLDTVDTTIPAGSFAQGILLSGVDASTSTSASANPEPVLIELTDSGDLSRFFSSTVHGCRLTASSYGVLSKERVMIRLEKLSCIEVETGEVMSTDVDGYVSGEDGKLGLRGTVVDRAGDHVRAAMMGGFLSSFGNFLASSANPVTFSSQTGLAQISSMTGSDLMKSGLSKGTSSALDKYTEFYIKRAEQLEPVIQVEAGRVIQVVFNKSVGIGKSALKQSVSSRNDKIRTQNLEHAEISGALSE